MTANTNIYTFDKRLLARMTGALGDPQTLSKICGELGQVFGEFLPDVLKSETGLDITIAYGGFESGEQTALIRKLGSGVALSDCSLRNWCDFIIGCDSPAIIALTEMLLGAEPEKVEESAPRTLSSIELQVAGLLTDKIADVLKSAVNAEGGFEPLVGRPVNAEKRPLPDADARTVYAACVTVTLGIGPVLSTFAIVIPQQVLLKTAIVFPQGMNQTRRQKPAFQAKLEEQVRRSMVELEARIRLESLTLGQVSRLQPGDIIPFHDAKDVRVEVNANGRELYVCEFGRSGARYTVRISDTHGSEQDILHHLMS
ncbi:FliM/FliN family flagellar motor switch protein [Rhizobium sp. YIM 134829]|uniref:FliM/FliN family flagellar motor switch protein n=1 Tax=Rhizobium sp. YIM 134829 TaxID=3390453 RepID=UPI00397D752F